MKRALISVYNKDGILELAKFLVENGVEIISTGGTYRFLKEKNIKVSDITELTNFTEILDGRVKTLHPYVHAGILAVRDNAEHMATLNRHSIDTIDYVIVNLYPFFEKVNEDISFEEKIEFIDIGGPSMLRSAAKSYKDVLVVCDKDDYPFIIEEMKKNKDVSIETRKKLAAKVFNLTSSYDNAIAQFLNDDLYDNKYLNVSYRKKESLRYGENPHQKAAFYIDNMNDGAMKNFKQLHGKELSFNNIRDMDVAWKIVNEFDGDVACCSVKHSTPCAVAIDNTSLAAYKKVYEADNVSIFGGIIAFNSTVDVETAKLINEIFIEIVIAKSFTAEALEILRQKKNIRLIECSLAPQDKYEYIKVDGGLLVQDVDAKTAYNLELKTENKDIAKYEKDLNFAMKVVKYVKSNAIVVAANGQTLGISGGSVNRIWPTEEAIKRAKILNENKNFNLVLASDGFFPFADIVEFSAKNDIKAIIQPGGSINDQKSIDECNKNNILMAFTNIRHFKH